MTKYPHDRPSKSDFKTFWSVFEAKQQRKQQQLEAQNQERERGKTET